MPWGVAVPAGAPAGSEDLPSPSPSFIGIPYAAKGSLRDTGNVDKCAGEAWRGPAVRTGTSRRRVVGSNYRVPHPNLPARNDACPESTPVEEVLEHLPTGSLRKKRARLTQLDALEHRITHPKLHSAQIIERDTVSHHISTRHARRKRPAHRSCKRINILDLYQSELIVGPATIRRNGISVTQEPGTRDRRDRISRLHRCPTARRDKDM